MARSDEPDDLPFLDAMRVLAVRQTAFLDQLGAGTRTRRTQVLCRRCNGPYLLASLRADPEGDCGCERPCERSGCLAPSEGATGDIMIIPDFP